MPPRKRLPKAPKEAPRIHPNLMRNAVPVEGLHTFHMNPNQGVVSLIAESLAKNGQYRSITVNVGTYTGRPDEILAGNHTYLAAKDELGWPDIAAEYIDVDEQAARRIVAADNATAEKARRDPDVLAEMLGILDSHEGTGLTKEEFDKLMNIDDLDGGDADDESGLLGKQTFSVIIECRDEDHQAELLETFEAEGLNARPMMT